MVIALEMIAAMEMARSVERNAFTSLMVTMRNMTAMVYVWEKLKSATFLVRLMLSSVEIILKQNVYLRLTLICSELVENQANVSQTWSLAE